MDGITDPADYHAFKPSKNEVAYLNKRLQGLVTIKHKKDCLNLPDKRYRKIICKPTASTLRVAEAIVQSAPNAVTGMTLLRELSDGFQYREAAGRHDSLHALQPMAPWPSGRTPTDQDRLYRDIDMLAPEVVARLVKQTVTCPVCGGATEVPKLVRTAREIPCPKEAALQMLLDENEETGRMVVFAGFTGSVDRVVKLCLKEKWNVVRCDQGAFQVLTHDEESGHGRAIGLLGQHGPSAAWPLRQPRVGRHEPDVGGGPHRGLLVQLVEAGVPHPELRTGFTASAWT